MRLRWLWGEGRGDRGWGGEGRGAEGWWGEGRGEGGWRGAGGRGSAVHSFDG